MARLGLEKLLPILMQNDVTQVAELRLLTDADFKEMSILIGSRRKILDALGTGGGVGLGQGGIGGGRGVAPASTSDSFLAGLASPPAAMAATALAAIGSSPQMDGAAGGGGGGSCDMFGALSMVGGGAVAPTQAVDIFGALSMAAGADAADVPPTPPSSASAFGFLGGGGEVNGQSSTAAAAWPSGVRMLDPGAFTDSDKLMTSVPCSLPPFCTSELQPHYTPVKSQPNPEASRELAFALTRTRTLALALAQPGARRCGGRNGSTAAWRPRAGGGPSTGTDRRTAALPARHGSRQ
jgi:hypothetical protein